MCRTTPSRSITYVTRPGTRPSVFSTPYSSRTLPSRSEGSRNGRPWLAAERPRGLPEAATHPDRLGISRRERVVAVPERARLDRAPGRLVLRIEVQHHGLAAHEITQPDRRAGLIGQREVRRRVTDTHLPLFGHRLPFFLELNGPPRPRPASPCSCASAAAAAATARSRRRTARTAARTTTSSPGASPGRSQSS